MDVPGGTQRNLWPSGRRAFSLWEPMSMARGWEALNLGLLGQDARVLPRRPRPLLQCSPGLPMRAGQAGPPPKQGSSACTRVALQPCAELACLDLCLLLQP